MVGGLRMKAILFKKAQVNDKTNIKYPANSMLVAPDKLAKELKQKYVDRGKASVVEIQDINYYFPNFHKDRHRRNPILFLRTGGIGDMLAFSSMFEQLKDHRTIFATLNVYKPCFQWYTTPPGTVREITQPLFEDLTFSRLRTHFGNLRYANYEGQVENFQRENWYKVFFEGIGLEWNPQLARPSMKKERIVPKHNHSKVDVKKSMIVTHRASAAMRTMGIKETVGAIKRSKFHDWKLYFHEHSLTVEEREIVKEVDRAIIIPKGSMHQAMLDWFDAAFVLSADTGAIHFREGVEKPALGVYGAFHPNSRTSTYQHVRSAYFESLCSVQPCYLHESESIKTCQYGKDLTFAPCLSSTLNPEFTDHLSLALNECYEYYSLSD